jgi:beta-aspartyl-peptidase (threonine type)
MEANGGNAESAAQRGIDLLQRKVDGFGGVIAMNARGEIGIAFNTPRMARAYMNETISKPVVLV